MIKLNEARFPAHGNAWLGALIGAGAALLGGLLSSKSSSDAAAANREAAADDTARNLAYQKEFAQHGVEWTVESARRAGVDPTVALGQSAHYYPTNYNAGHQGTDYSFIDKMGQDLKGAFDRSAMKSQRELRQLQLERAHLENDYALIRNMKASKELMNQDTQQGPALPNSVDPYGEPDGIIHNSSNRVVHQADTRTRSHASNPGETAATQPFNTTWIDKDGRLRSTISERSAESVESDWVGWAENNAIRAGQKVKSYFVKPPYPERKPPKGHIWEWRVTPTGGYWFAVKKGKPGSLRWEGKSYKGDRVIHHGKIWR